VPVINLKIEYALLVAPVEESSPGILSSIMPRKQHRKHELEESADKSIQSIEYDYNNVKASLEEEIKRNFSSELLIYKL
jgi:hypothetical protein